MRRAADEGQRFSETICAGRRSWETPHPIHSVKLMKRYNHSVRYSLRAAIICVASTATVFSLASCNVKQTQEAKAPEVQVKEGQLPKYDVDTAKVTVDSQKKEVTVPKVTTEQKTITVPDVNVTMPGESASPAAVASPNP